MKSLNNLIIEQPSKYVTRISLNRPQSLNALNLSTCDELRNALVQCRKSKQVRAIILTGAGSKAFCAGADLKERANLTPQRWLKDHLKFERLAEEMLEFKIPIIAAVNGIAFGGGCELALLSDIIIASTAASFAQPEVKIGIIPGMGGTQKLRDRVGIAKAKQLILTGQSISANVAAEWGLASMVCSPAKLQSVALNVARIISTNSPGAVRLAKQAVDGAKSIIVQNMRTELRHYKAAIRSREYFEGVRAFIEKREPRF